MQSGTGSDGRSAAPTAGAPPRDPAHAARAGLTRHTSVSQWAEFNARCIVPLDIRVITDEGIDVSARASVTSCVRAVHLVANAHAVERSSSLVRQRPVDEILVVMLLRGHVSTLQNGRTAATRPGQLTIAELDRPFVSIFDHHTEIAALVVSRRLFARATTGLQIDSPVRIEVDANPYASALRDRVLQVTGAGGEAGSLLTPSFVGYMLRGVFGGEVPPGDHLAAAQRYIAAQLRDPSLSASGIAAATGISKRHLSRIFADLGTSVPQYVRSRRLELAMAAIQRADSVTTVAHLARECGYLSSSHFSRNFTAHFHVHPSDALRLASAQRLRHVLPPTAPAQVAGMPEGAAWYEAAPDCSRG